MANPKKQLENTTRASLLFSLLAVFIFNGWILYVNFQKVSAQEDWVKHTYEVVEQLNLVKSDIRGAASNIRSYIISRNHDYISTANLELESARVHFASAKGLTADNLVQQDYANELDALIKKTAVAFQQAEDKVKQSQGSAVNIALFAEEELQYQSITKLILKMESTEFDLLDWRAESSKQSKNIFFAVLILTTLFGLAVIIFAYIQTRKNQLLALKKAEEKSAEAAEKDKIAEVSGVVAGDPSTKVAGEGLLKFFARNFNIVASKLYLFEAGEPVVIAALGIDTKDRLNNFEKKLILDAADKKTAWQLRAIPDNYWRIKSGLGSSLPKVLAFLPLNFQGAPIGVVEMALFEELSDESLELLYKFAGPVAVGLNAAQSRQALQALLEKTQQQSEELQAQQEELRVSNEELSEQTEALKEAQANLEEQRAELETTNEQLEDQTQTLEHQKDILNTKNNELTQAQARVESASRYKSEFLANMSHELRTPLNSSLILSKLLADNVDGNLTPEQVEFARAISSSGQDLLELINDILDLSKVEAGKLELYVERVQINEIKSSIETIFTPIAEQKKLKFTVEVEPKTSAWIETDKQRLEQVLKNLLSNAFKFTTSGSVKLRIGNLNNDNEFAFAITDTGIGIAKEQQNVIFEAFRQADGTTNRKYGGTGLGLSISRDLAHLLGGRIEVKSETGKGSTFTFICPRNSSTPSEIPQSDKMPGGLASTKAAGKEPPGRRIEPFIPDDRDHLVGAVKKILAIEDDKQFAQILYDLSHEMGFKCVVAECAEDGLTLATQILPDAILLDIKLPDHSGLWVLDRLKDTPQTRHIPVHVISAFDNTQAAMQMGAIGHLLKPTDRKDLEEAFSFIDKKLLQRMKKVLLVEDDDNQRTAVLKLIGGSDVDITAVATGKEALALLKKDPFDCMILDLSLPDMTGYELLGQLSQAAFSTRPPVIVYTGRSLTRAEENELRKYSHSIILKGAKSPERLMNEVGLFLHRVESKMPIEKQSLLKEARSREKTFEGKTILVVDDDVRNIFALTSALETKGAKVEIGRNGIQAIEKVNSNDKIDLVLMDIMMPEMDGYDSIRNIRKNKKFAQLPIIAVTARAMRDDQEKCIAAGASDYLSKPIDLEKLVSLVRIWLTTAEKKN